MEYERNDADFWRQQISRLRKEDDKYWRGSLNTPGYAALVRELANAHLALAQALTNSSDYEQLQEGLNACVRAEHLYKQLDLADEQAKAICQHGYIVERYDVKVTHQNSQGPAIFFESAVRTATPAMKPHYERELAEFKRRWRARQGK